MSRFEQKVLIRETHLDVFGHVNNATYLTIFEDARWDFLFSLGIDIHSIKKAQIGPVILECQVKFLREIRAREEIIVTVEPLMENITERSKVFLMKQQMFNQKGELACDGVLTFGVFDLQNRRLILPPMEWRKAFGLDI